MPKQDSPQLDIPALLAETAALQQRVQRFERVLASLPEFALVSRQDDPLPLLHTLLAELLEAECVAVHVPVPFAATKARKHVLQAAITIGRRPVGLIEATRVQPFGLDDMAIANALGLIVGVVLEQTTLQTQFDQYRSQAQAAADTLDQLLVFARVVNSGSSDLQQLGVQLATQVTTMVGGDRASLLLTLPDTPQMPMLILSNGTVSAPERAISVRDNGLAGLVLRERRPMIIDETDTDRRWFSLSAHDYDAPTRCAMAVPLIWGERVLGVITVTTTQTHLFDTPQLNLLDLIASHVALALHSALLQARARTICVALDDIAHIINSALQAAQLNVQLMISSSESQGMLMVERDDLYTLDGTLARIGDAARQLHVLQRELSLPTNL